MRDSALMRNDECICYLDCNRKRAQGFEWLSREDFLQRAPFDELHHDIVKTVGLTYIVNGSDVWMIERGTKACFAFETASRTVGRGQLGQQGLEYDHTIEPQVLSLVRCGLPALAKLFDDAVV